jgi:chemotaxis protein methyltransferase CheR
LCVRLQCAPSRAAKSAAFCDTGAVKDAELRLLLQRAWPRLGLRAPAFRNVAGQVYKRIRRRIALLGLADAAAYEAHLQAEPAEWQTLDQLCRVTISRFQRDAPTWQRLGQDVLPVLAEAALAAGETTLRCWSAGCASGEEPYTLSLLWAFQLASSYPALQLSVLATDAGQAVLARARAAHYAPATLRELPQGWRERAFEPTDGGALQLREPFRKPVEVRCADLRGDLPQLCFRLILCRNLAFTYFDEALQRETLQRLLSRLMPGGALVIGKGEALPQGAELEAWGDAGQIYRR